MTDIDLNDPGASAARAMLSQYREGRFEIIVTMADTKACLLDLWAAMYPGVPPPRIECPRTDADTPRGNERTD